MKFKILMLLACISVAVTPAQMNEQEELRPRTWSVPDNGLSVRLQVRSATTDSGSSMEVKLHIRASAPDTKHARLLQGNFVFTLVPFTDPERRRKTESTHHHFSGAGGVDYSGKEPLSYKITVPEKEGKYHLIATVVSSIEDVDAFLITAKITADAGPWWTGAISTPPVLIEVVGD